VDTSSVIGSVAGQSLVRDPFMVSDYFSDDEVQELLGDLGCNPATSHATGEVTGERRSLLPLSNAVHR
jgi:hypothetical protein